MIEQNHHNPWQDVKEALINTLNFDADQLNQLVATFIMRINAGLIPFAARTAAMTQYNLQDVLDIIGSMDMNPDIMPHHKNAIAQAILNRLHPHN